MKKIPLSQGKFALIDDEDFNRVSQFKWSAIFNSGKYYAGRSVIINGVHSYIRMHRFILNAPDGLDVDHKNRDGLDNRKNNIRICTRSQNTTNSVKHKDGKLRYKGIATQSGKFVARIWVGNKKLYLGIFKTDTEAARAYNLAAQKYFRGFARLNDC